MSSHCRKELADIIASTGAFDDDPALRASFERVPREIFLGDAVYRLNGTTWEPLRREDVGEEEWLRLACTDQTWVTQVEGVDARDATGALSGNPTSSSTLPSLVARMVRVAGVRGGDTVLEIGTGTGYSTAILADRLGEARVTSVEYDPGTARRAADHLNAAGYAPHLVVGDGLQGCKEHAEYDALVATCAVRHIPLPWLWQVRAGGSITTAVGGWMLASGLVRLVVGDGGSASGRFTGDTVSYMLARPHERPPRPVFFRHGGDARASLVDPAVLEDWTGHFVAQLGAPSAELMQTGDGVVLVDVATGSQAWTEAADGGWTVHQSGPLRLWDQVEAAVMTWQAAGSPGQSAFGMSVSPDCTQTVWLGSPEGPSWRLPC